MGCPESLVKEIARTFNMYQSDEFDYLLFKYYLQLVYTVGYDAGIGDQRKKHANNMNKPVKMIYKGEVLRTFNSCREASRFVNRAHNSIIHALKYNQRCAGFNWEYVTLDDNKLKKK